MKEHRRFTVWRHITHTHTHTVPDFAASKILR